MPNVDPMFHMDMDYNWIWFICDQLGSPILVSARSFFDYEEAKRDYEMARLIMTQAA